MCNLYHVSPKDEFEVYVRRHAAGWTVPAYEMRTVGPYQPGVFFRPCSESVIGQVGQWGMIRPGQPERIDYMPSKVPGRKGRPRSTNNARAETAATRPTFKAAWAAGRRCLIPAVWYQEPNWETGRNIWWHLKRADGLPWMLAGLWSEWTDPASGEIVPNFTMLTVNCDSHPMLNRLHKPDPDLAPDAQDKRAVVHIQPEHWRAWFTGSPDEVTQLLMPSPVEVFDQGDAIKTDLLLAGDQPPPLF